ncbi:MAG: PAS domain-containing sensor histidine kinase [Caldilineaceae bacterium]|nr:PAS domain-containing sensor histidine kinase [Caldilineaceae bacterium]
MSVEPTVLSTIIDEFKRRGIGYVVTDRDLTIVATHGDPHLFRECDPAYIGLPLTEAAQELVGNESVLAAIQTGAAERLRFDLVNRTLEDGRSIYVRMTDLPYYDKSGECVGIVHLVEDISDAALQQHKVLQQRNELALLQRKQAQIISDLTATSDELRRINAFNQSFLTVAAHQLTEPLTVIGGFVELLRDRLKEAADDPNAMTMDTLAEAVDRLQRVTENLLGMLSLESQLEQALPQSSSLAELIFEVMDDMRPDIEQKSINLALEIPDGLPEVLCDDDQTVRLLRNLLKIAIDCTPEHGDLSISLEEDAERKRVCLTVRCSHNSLTNADLESLSVLSEQHNRILLGNNRGNTLELYVALALLRLQNGDLQVHDSDQEPRALVVMLPIAGKDGQ